MMVSSFLCNYETRDIILFILNMVGIIMLMSIVLPFIYMTLVIKWWILGSLALFIFALATPDYLVDEMWDRTFLRSPFVTLWGIISTKLLGKKLNFMKDKR